MKNVMLLVTVLFFLGGCAGSDYIIPLDMGEETGETARSMATTTGDASMYKEYVRYHAWEVYYQEMEEAQEESGIKIGYMEVTLSDGTKGTVLLPWEVKGTTGEFIHCEVYI